MNFLSMFNNNLKNNDYCIKLLYHCYFTRLDLTSLANDLYNVMQTLT